MDGPGGIGKRKKACVQCHRQKQKCNNGKPCSNCLRRNIPQECAYTDSRERRPWHRQRTEVRADPASEETAHGNVDSNAGLPPVSSPSVQRNHLSSPTVYQHCSETAHSDSTLEVQRLARLYKARGAPSYHGTSYFGHQSAALLMGQSTSEEIPGGSESRLSYRARTAGTQPYRTETGPFSLIWERIGSLPRQKSVVDHLVQKFFEEFNSVVDAIHEATFQESYTKFWDRRLGFEDLSSVDLRWLALLFIVLAFGELLACPQPCSAEKQRSQEDSSLHYYWSARKAIVIAPSFYGESPDIVRCGLLVTRYLMFTRRISESWLTACFAVRMAQAQGMHADGEQLGLPRKAIETRRRVWSQLYLLERTISLALGRPNSINDRNCGRNEGSNVWIDDLTDEGARQAVAKPFSEPTPTMLSILSRQLAMITGHIADNCFTLFASHRDVNYDEIITHDMKLVAWKDTLPAYFKLEDPDTSADASCPYLSWHRLYLHSCYHFVRITLHRSYLLRVSITDQYSYSRVACLSSATADLKIRLGCHNPTMADRLRYNISSQQLFNSALILGVIVVRDPFSSQTEPILEDLRAYCDRQNADTWVNEFDLAEVRVIELCISRTRLRRAQGPRWQNDAASGTRSTEHESGAPPFSCLNGTPYSADPMTGMQGLQTSREPPVDTDMWSDWMTHAGYEFPDLMDFQIWEGLVEDLATSATR